MGAAAEVAETAASQAAPVEENLVDLQVCEHADRIHKRTDRDVVAENRRILATERTCAKWVKSHRKHNVVCRYCAKGVTPSVRWKWYRGVWYRWWSGRWHYFGPSRRGNGGAWKWYQGYWHYRGYVFKYWNGKWYRYYHGKWNYYKHGYVPQNPKPPTTKPYCISVYKLVRRGLPDGLAISRVPRCRVGSTFYLWEGPKKCAILGGRKAFRRQQKCKKGSLHRWQKVRRCTRPAVIKAGKFNYGKKKKETGDEKWGIKYRRHRTYKIGGLGEGKCYQFKNAQFTHRKMAYSNTRVYVSLSIKQQSHYIWKLTPALDHNKNAISLRRMDRKGRPFFLRHQGFVAKAHPFVNTKLFRADSSFLVAHSLTGQKDGVSFMSVNYRKYFLGPQGADGILRIAKYQNEGSYYLNTMSKKFKTWVPIKADCLKGYTAQPVS